MTRALRPAAWGVGAATGFRYEPGGVSRTFVLCDEAIHHSSR